MPFIFDPDNEPVWIGDSHEINRPALRHYGRCCVCRGLTIPGDDYCSEDCHEEAHYRGLARDTKFSRGLDVGTERALLVAGPVLVFHIIGGVLFPATDAGPRIAIGFLIGAALLWWREGNRK